jgi:hypothetical protein
MLTILFALGGASLAYMHKYICNIDPRDDHQQKETAGKCTSNSASRDTSLHPESNSRGHESQNHVAGYSFADLEAFCDLCEARYGDGSNAKGEEAKGRTHEDGGNVRSTDALKTELRCSGAETDMQCTTHDQSKDESFRCDRDAVFGACNIGVNGANCDVGTGSCIRADGAMVQLGADAHQFNTSVYNNNNSVGNGSYIPNQAVVTRKEQCREFRDTDTGFKNGFSTCKDGLGSPKYWIQDLSSFGSDPPMTTCKDISVPRNHMIARNGQKDTVVPFHALALLQDIAIVNTAVSPTAAGPRRVDVPMFGNSSGNHDSSESESHCEDGFLLKCKDAYTLERVDRNMFIHISSIEAVPASSSCTPKNTNVWTSANDVFDLNVGTFDVFKSREERQRTRPVDESG